ncbi:MAG: hypothetical protein KDD27_15730, partial [Saprospiraceae bacterium]|nr:hypothetical protein [Saprospiraceae bacterium]
VKPPAKPMWRHLFDPFHCQSALSLPSANRNVMKAGRNATLAALLVQQSLPRDFRVVAGNDLKR